MPLPSHVEIKAPEPFLQWLASAPATVSVPSFSLVQAWGLVGLAVLARAESVIQGVEHRDPAEPTRTVPMRRFKHLGEIERLARDVARLAVPAPSEADTRRVLEYVMIELFRNVLQHGGDPLGGVAAAQAMLAGHRGYSQDTIQVAVGDAGMGIPASLAATVPEASDPTVALERALWPHVSRAFEPGLSGSSENAGLGLFFVAEIAKLTAGRLLIATRGATLLLQGATDPEDEHARQTLSRVGFPGTLVAFELNLGEVKDYDALITRVQERATARAPQRAVHRWIQHENAPPDALTLLVSVVAEDTAEATKFAQERLVPLLMQRKTVVLDFTNMPTGTQSFVHALLFDAVRLAWALRTPLHVSNASPSIRSALTLLESYALGG